MGHYLSATAMLSRQTVEHQTEIRQRMEYVVAELKKVQDALGGGYLSAFPAEHFDRLQDLKPVWAPYYVVHKIMAGLLDQYTFAGNELALQMCVDEAAYFLKRIDATLAVNGTAHWHEMLNNEFGGMNEVMYNLHAVTKDPEHLRMADLFTKPAFFEPLVAKQDPLAGLHANTHLAQVNGFASAYEKAGNKTGLAVVSHFYSTLTSRHSFSTGGSNDHEFWGLPNEVGTITATQKDTTETQETCTQYNLLKITRSLFRWTGDPAFADFYERAVFGILGTQRMPSAGPAPALQPASSAIGMWLARDSPAAAVPAVDPYTQNWREAAFLRFGNGSSSLAAPNGASAPSPLHNNAPGPGVVLYLTPMGTGQTKGENAHGWGDPFGSFWCCHGSSVESFAKLADSIYFYRRTNRPSAFAAAAGGRILELYVNQMVSSTLKSAELGVAIDQEASLYGPDNTATATLAVKVEEPAADDRAAAARDVHLKLRVPHWIVPGKSWLKVNGKQVNDCGNGGAANGPQPGSYCTVRLQRASPATTTHVQLHFGLSIYAAPVQDSRPEFANLQSVMMGPLVMAGLTPDTRTIALDPATLASHVSDVATQGLVSIRVAPADQHSPHSMDRSMYLRHSASAVVAAPLSDIHSPMDATFRLVKAPGSGTGPGGVVGSANVALEALEMAELADGMHIVLESMQWPGRLVAVDQQGQYVVVPFHEVVEERYTVYFEFTPPASSAATMEQPSISVS
ncbi:hypothetical protein WJX72_006497 [[Myrmecia] bisecta]|uniref:Uncharacterized protein n=1 Tax=[Myrmecia] bisecta TaxID=41462 RepID=A0AAW1P6Y9_9CHLO